MRHTLGKSGNSRNFGETLLIWEGLPMKVLLLLLVITQTGHSEKIGAPTTTTATTLATSRPIDIGKEKTLFVVGYAHLDTQWRWAYPQVIREFIPNTMRDNFPL